MRQDSFSLFPFHPLQDESHSEWVSCVRFSPNSSNPIIVSCGWDKLVKVSLEQGCKAFTNQNVFPLPPSWS